MAMKTMKTREKYMPTISKILNICNYLMEMTEHLREQIQVKTKLKNEILPVMDTGKKMLRLTSYRGLI